MSLSCVAVYKPIGMCTNPNDIELRCATATYITSELVFTLSESIRWYVHPHAIWCFIIITVKHILIKKNKSMV
jgi:hypothetical protein